MSLTAITRDGHANKYWLRRSSFSFAAGHSAVPLVAFEVSVAATSIPIAFLKQGDTYEMVVLTGLAPNQNLLVSTDGSWLAPYIPAEYRVGPFRLAKNETGELLLCVDESSGQITDGPEGERFFEDNGELTENLDHMLSLLGQMNVSRQLTEQACLALNQHNLFEPWEITLVGEEGEHRVDGVYRINELALNALSDESFSQIRHAGALPIAYSQLISMQHIKTLSQLHAQRVQAQSYVQTEMSSDTFSFSNLN